MSSINTTEPDLIEEVEELLANPTKRAGRTGHAYELLRRLVEEVKRRDGLIAEVAELGCLRGRQVHCVEREPTPADWCIACQAKYLFQERRDEEKQPTESI